MKKTLFLTFLIVFITSIVFAQEKIIEGIVFDKDTRYRLSRVKITNLNTLKSSYNSTKGEFNLSVKNRDLLVFSLQGYRNDTVKIVSQNTLVVYLQRLAIPLREVIVIDTALSPQQKYEETKKQFNRIYRGNNKDLLSTGPGGVGLSIDAIWSSFSKEGKNARKLAEIMERDFQNAVIDMRFNKTLVVKNTGLKGEKLIAFMNVYRPSYAFMAKASEYELLSYVKIAYQKFSNYSFYQDVSNLKPISIND